MKVNDLVRGIAQDLADLELGFEFTTYHEDQIRRLINEARCVVFEMQPSKFSQVVKVLLEPCKAVQDAGCENVISVLEQVDEKGCHVAEVAEKSTPKHRITWNKRSNCSTTNDYTASSYTIIDGLSGSFVVDPPPPAGVNVWFNVLCASKPSDLGEDDELGCDEAAWVSHYVIYRLLSIDTESSGHVNVAKMYFENFRVLIGLADKAERDFKLSTSFNKGVQKR